MFGSLLAKATGSLSKSFVMSGLLPGALMTVALWLYFGPENGNQDVSALLSFGNGHPEDITAIAAFWLASALVLFAAKGPVFSAFQIMPTGYAGRILLKRPLRRRRELYLRRDHLAWRYTVLLWHQRSFDPDNARYLPSTVTGKAAENAARKSQEARLQLRAALSILDDPNKLQSNEARVISEGIEALFAATVRETTPLITANKDKKVTLNDVSPVLAAEIRAWQDTCSQSHGALRGGDLLESIASEVDREWKSVQSRCLLYPEGVRIYPTSFGNRIAALDDYAQQRYGIETEIIWGRMWWELSTSARNEISDARLAVEGALVFSTACGAMIILVPGIQFFPAIAHFLSLHTIAGITNLMVFLVLLLILMLTSYWGAVFALQVLSGKMTALIDLNRLRVLRSLGFSAKTVAEELELFQELQDFFAQAVERKPERSLVSARSARVSLDGNGKDKKSGGRKTARRA